MKRRYVGHCNVGTDIKQASFLGQRGNFLRVENLMLSECNSRVVGKGKSLQKFEKPALLTFCEHFITQFQVNILRVEAMMVGGLYGRNRRGGL